MYSESLMKELVDKLNRASAAYYGGKDEEMTNYEWDRLFNQLKEMEAESGIVLPDSPTATVGAAVSDPRREVHEYPALSLDKSKDINVIRKWLGNNEGWLGWKCDGCTVIAIFHGNGSDDGFGSLTKLVTRGDGRVGKNITELAPYIRNLPLTVPYSGHLVVRGEAMISYPDFERVNETLGEDEQYANPRNLTAGTLSLEGERAPEVAERGVFLTAFTPVHFDEDDIIKVKGKSFNAESWGERMNALDAMGFHTVERKRVNTFSLESVMAEYTDRVKGIDFPVDGLVCCYDSYSLSQQGSVTGHHATNAGIAYKWQDESKETTLRKIEWSCGTQCITPVAVFDPVELEGTTVSRATLHNITYCKTLKLGIGAQVKVAKMNMIIPAVVENTTPMDNLEIPAVCPVCGAPTTVSVSPKNGTETIHCTNEDCPAKQLRKFSRFAERDGFDLDGLSSQTFKALIDAGLVKEYADLYELKNHHAEIVEMEGFGEKSYQQMVDAIEKKKEIHPVNFIYALSIPVWGRDATKRVLKKIGSKEFFHRLLHNEGFEDIDNIGPEKTAAVLKWWSDKKNLAIVKNLLKHMKVTTVEPDKGGGTCEGKTFVITGSVSIFKNRDEFKAYVEKNGGHVSGTVSKGTNYLVTNELSNTVKSQRAVSLGIPVITEAQFLEMF